MILESVYQLAETFVADSTAPHDSIALLVALLSSSPDFLLLTSIISGMNTPLLNALFASMGVLVPLSS